MTTEHVTHDELDIAFGKVLSEAKTYTDAAERRLREEWTDTVRFETGRVDSHLDAQDGKINWLLGLMVTILLGVIGWLVYFALSHH